jgi:hypothetical protein
MLIQILDKHPTKAPGIAVEQAARECLLAWLQTRALTIGVD